MFTQAGTKFQSGSSRDGNALAALYDQYQLGLRSVDQSRSAGFYGATERIDLSLKALMSVVEFEKTRPGRKLMIWFSPGWPMLSDTRSPLPPKESSRPSTRSCQRPPSCGRLASLYIALTPQPRERWPTAEHVLRGLLERRQVAVECFARQPGLARAGGAKRRTRLQYLQ